ncbi:hypothetical protein [Acaryochloris sp. IP29b_bin.148]|uniref:hypothetical protein n=1 Tax=Acaryochloris sp. IP29b_bin.148 TaxID=2969218 RepID=UPI002608CDC1|nr:hypothetical protein [Acaryochloris sp. IP29b_bin.148]
MSSLTSPTTPRSLFDHTDVFWPDLREVISGSSGFKRWVLEQGLDANAQGTTLDILVRSYLKQTLETLAY